MGLDVLLVGKDNKDIERVKKHLDNEDIPFKFFDLGDISKSKVFSKKKLPIVYIAGYRLEGVKDILSRVREIYSEYV